MVEKSLIPIGIMIAAIGVLHVAKTKNFTFGSAVGWLAKQIGADKTPPIDANQPWYMRSSTIAGPISTVTPLPGTIFPLVSGATQNSTDAALGNSTNYTYFGSPIDQALLFADYMP